MDDEKTKGKRKTIKDLFDKWFIAQGGKGANVPRIEYLNMKDAFTAGFDAAKAGE